jgi:hypothetical protein
MPVRLSLRMAEQNRGYHVLTGEQLYHIKRASTADSPSTHHLGHSPIEASARAVPVDLRSCLQVVALRGGEADDVAGR